MQNFNLENNSFLRQFEIMVDDTMARIEYAEQERKIFLTKLIVPENIVSEELKENCYISMLQGGYPFRLKDEIYEVVDDAIRDDYPDPGYEDIPKEEDDD